MADDASLRYVIPREGSQIWVDNLCIPAKAPHRDLAEKFVNFVLEPQVGARLSNFLQFATPNAAARAFIKPADLKNPAIYPRPTWWPSWSSSSTSALRPSSTTRRGRR